MPEEEELKAEVNDPLQEALKKLNEGVNWDNALFSLKKDEESCLRNSVKMPEEREDQKKAVKNSRKLSNRACRQRNQPYQKDNLPFTDNNLPSMDNLTFATEICKNKNCTCNQPKHASPEKNKAEKYPLNFAHASRYEKESGGGMIAEPKLKLHHREKDRRVVIRAARLKLAKHFRQQQQQQPVFSSSAAPKLGAVHKNTVFGSSQSQKNTNFASLSTPPEAPKPESAAAAASPEFLGRSFGSYRQETASSSSQTSTSMQANRAEGGGSGSDAARGGGSSDVARERLDLSSLESSLPRTASITGSAPKCRGEKRRSAVSPPRPLHPGHCSRPCSCSQQAAMTPDYTVDELACYFDEFVHIPKKMSFMAEMMYT